MAWVFRPMWRVLGGEHRVGMLGAVCVCVCVCVCVFCQECIGVDFAMSGQPDRLPYPLFV